MKALPQTINARRDGLLIVFLGCAIFVSVGTALQLLSTQSLQDFKVVYYGARCIIAGSDPYRDENVLRIYEADAGKSRLRADDSSQQQAISRFLYLPSVSVLVAPFALLPWSIAHLSWMTATAASLILASFLIWQVAADSAPLLAAALVALLLCNSIGLLLIGNSAGIAVSLCMISVWCFARQKAVPLGIVCMALSLAAKPHDAVLIWLYFLLTGGLQRKRALVVLLLTVALSLPSVLWVSHTSPGWFREMNQNLSASSSNGGLNDPTPSAASSASPVMLLNLQAAIAVFCNDARLYNPISYILCAPLLVVWMAGVRRSRHRPETIWFALAAVAPLSLLPLYHRPHDSRLLLLSVPVCAILGNPREHSGGCLLPSPLYPSP